MILRMKAFRRKRKQSVLGRETCPVITFEKMRARGSALIRAYAGDESVGEVFLEKDPVGNVPYVANIRVKPELQRCGVGTQLYEQAAQFACRVFRKPLHSDIYRSEMTDRFWQKQVQKGRAVCVTKVPRSMVEKGLPPDAFAIGRSGCKRYRLMCPAPPVLSRADRRHR
jgi:GNAT superfamily N-acetyltransferase